MNPPAMDVEGMAERQHEVRGHERESERERESVCVCVCVANGDDVQGGPGGDERSAEAAG